MTRVFPRLMSHFLAMSRSLSAGPTRMGAISPFAPASMAAINAVSSQGCATAVGTGSRPRHLSRSASYFPVPVVRFMIPRMRPGEPGDQLAAAASRFLQEKCEDDSQADAVQQGFERRLIVLKAAARRRRRCPPREASQTPARARR